MDSSILDFSYDGRQICVLRVDCVAGNLIEGKERKIKQTLKQLSKKYLKFLKFCRK